jgi:hypothetical protein
MLSTIILKNTQKEEKKKRGFWIFEREKGRASGDVSTCSGGWWV